MIEEKLKQKLQFTNLSEDEKDQFCDLIIKLKPDKKAFKSFYESYRDEDQLPFDGGFMFYEAICAIYNSIGIYE